VPDVTPCCPAGPNSAGPGATLTWRGPVNPAQGQLVLEGLPPSAPVIYVYGQARQQLPYGNGSLCVGPSAFILARSRADANGVATLRVAQGEVEDARWLLSGLLTDVDFQAIYGDAGALGLANTSNALDVVFE
jgi:hypothetical protein